jgi:hypothetical protein
MQLAVEQQDGRQQDDDREQVNGMSPDQALSVIG